EHFFLAHRLAGEFRIDARGPEEQKLFRASLVAALNSIERDREILGDEFSGINVVGMNAADFARSNNNHVGLGRSQKSFRLLLAFEIDLSAAGRDYVATAGSETPHDRRSHHAAVTRDVNPLTSKIEDLGEHHIEFVLYCTLSRSGCGVPARTGP